MGNEFIADGASCQCTMGSAKGKISVTDQMFSHLNGSKLCATTQTVGKKAIAPPFFGSCSATRSSCKPNISQWSNFCTKLKIGTAFPLTDKSIGMCSCGGTIKFTDTGQQGGEKMEEASGESQGELDPMGEPMALTEPQTTVLSEVELVVTPPPARPTPPNDYSFLLEISGPKK